MTRLKSQQRQRLDVITNQDRRLSATSSISKFLFTSFHID